MKGSTKKALLIFFYGICILSTWQFMIYATTNTSALDIAVIILSIVGISTAAKITDKLGTARIILLVIVAMLMGTTTYKHEKEIQYWKDFYSELEDSLLKEEDALKVFQESEFGKEEKIYTYIGDTYGYIFTKYNTQLGIIVVNDQKVLSNNHIEMEEDFTILNNINLEGKQISFIANKNNEIYHYTIDCTGESYVEGVQERHEYISKANKEMDEEYLTNLFNSYYPNHSILSLAVANTDSPIGLVVYQDEGSIGLAEFDRYYPTGKNSFTTIKATTTITASIQEDIITFGPFDKEDYQVQIKVTLTNGIVSALEKI